MIKSKHLSRGAKLRIYETVNRPTVTYGCKTWVFNNQSTMKLDKWERKILWTIFGGVPERDGGRRRTNQ